MQISSLTGEPPLEPIHFDPLAMLQNFLLSVQHGHGSEALMMMMIPEAGQVEEGVYNITTKTEQYIGQSYNPIRRFAQHFAGSGKLSGSELQTAILYSMPGSTQLEREVYEQYVIDQLGINKLKNIVNPMGGRRDLYNSMIPGVISKYNLPTGF